MNKSNLTIACVGGGLSGSLAAISLMKSLSPHIDIDFHVFEQHENPFDSENQASSAYLAQYDARNIVLSSATIVFLKQLGLWDELQSFLVPIHQLHISKAHAFESPLESGPFLLI